MVDLSGIFVGKGDVPVNLLPSRANRHGLIAGATGTGKTVTLQVLAESFSQLGVPVFLADVKGDLAGISQPGGGKPKLEERAQELGIDLKYEGSPVVFWDLFGEQGHPIRTTISEMGPLLLSRLLDLNETQEGVLNVAFRVADDQGLLLLDLKDLRSMLTFLADNAKQIQAEYGNVAGATVGAVQRQLLTLEEQGGDKFFGEPALELKDLMRTAQNGRGYVNILAADKLMQSPKLYGTFLLWLLAELFEELPEVGDPEKPKLVFIFDEAHLLFNDAPKALVEKVEQVVRLIRSKGVGVYFVTQNPIDVPETVLGQLGNRFQHALRAFTPREQKAVKAASETFRPNPNFKVEEAILNLGVGVALASVLDEKGAPTVTEITKIRPPASQLGPIDADQRAAIIAGSPVAHVYDVLRDRESAYEILSAKARAIQAEQEAEEREKAEAKAEAAAEKAAEAEAKRQERERREIERQYRSETYGRRAPTRRSTAQSPIEKMVNSTVRTMGSQLGREIVRGVLGNLFKKR